MHLGVEQDLEVMAKGASLVENPGVVPEPSKHLLASRRVGVPGSCCEALHEEWVAFACLLVPLRVKFVDRPILDLLADGCRRRGRSKAARPVQNEAIHLGVVGQGLDQGALDHKVVLRLHHALHTHDAQVPRVHQHEPPMSERLAFPIFAGPSSMGT